MIKQEIIKKIQNNENLMSNFNICLLKDVVIKTFFMKY